jgi:hypothetical protein
MRSERQARARLQATEPRRTRRRWIAWKEPASKDAARSTVTLSPTTERVERNTAEPVNKRIRR